MSNGTHFLKYNCKYKLIVMKDPQDDIFYTIDKNGDLNLYKPNDVNDVYRKAIILVSSIEYKNNLIKVLDNISKKIIKGCCYIKVYEYIGKKETIINSTTELRYHDEKIVNFPIIAYHNSIFQLNLINSDIDCNRLRVDSNGYENNSLTFINVSVYKDSDIILDNISGILNNGILDGKSYIGDCIINLNNFRISNSVIRHSSNLHYRIKGILNNDNCTYFKIDRAELILYSYDYNFGSISPYKHIESFITTYNLNADVYLNNSSICLLEKNSDNIHNVKKELYFTNLNKQFNYKTFNIGITDNHLTTIGHVDDIYYIREENEIRKYYLDTNRYDYIGKIIDPLNNNGYTHLPYYKGMESRLPYYTYIEIKEKINNAFTYSY